MNMHNINMNRINKAQGAGLAAGVWSAARASHAPPSRDRGRHGRDVFHPGGGEEEDRGVQPF
eukprot:1514907-Lingulodinium_polyedra.AAC.1